MDGPGGCGEVASSVCVIGSELHSGKVTCIYGGGEKDWAKHDAVAALVTRSLPTA